MSQPKRYDCADSNGMHECMAYMDECENGEYVTYSDYAALAAEVEHLKTRPTLANQYAEYAALAAENERLNDIVNHYYHIPNADTVPYASWSKLSAEYEQVKQAGLMLADTSKAVVKQLKDQVFSVCEQRDALAAEAEVLRKKVDWLMKADRLVIWNGTEWQVRHVVEQLIKPRE